MSGALQAVFQNQRSFGAPVPSGIGAAYGGGYYAGSISTAGNSVADYYLVIGPKSSAESFKKWKTVSTSTTGTDSVIDGPANSAAMNNASHPAAEFCEAVTAGGFSDWYMPAKNEFEVCYYNLKPSTANNNTSSGINANAVPARASNYTTGTPTQTTAAAFQSPSGAERFTQTNYWSSTQFSAQAAWATYSFSGYQRTAIYKETSIYVRAVRRVAV
jgi:hypothetical protein